MHEHHHQRRLKRIEKLVSAESMLTNDLLGIVIEKGCYIDKKLQTHLLDEIVAIADTLIMRQAFCSWDDKQSYQDELQGNALKRLASGLAGIMHQLLNEIHDHALFIISDNSADVVEHVRLRNIQNTVEKGRQLLRDLTGNDAVRLASAERTDVRAMTEAVFDVCCQGHEDIRKHFTINSSLYDVKADRLQISTILQRLYDNAVAAMPSGGEIYLTLENIWPVSKEMHSRYVRLIFKDTGTGMTPEIAARIFDPFFTAKALKGRRGLGLTSVAGLLQTIDGQISVKSTPGKGSIFTIDLPAAVDEPVKWSVPSNVYHAPIKRWA
jgi:signal transduction histidine kinase